MRLENTLTAVDLLSDRRRAVTVTLFTASGITTLTAGCGCAMTANQETRYGYDGLGRRVFKRTVNAGEHTAALRWFWWEGDALMAEAQETEDTTETCTAASDIQLPGSDHARREKLVKLTQGLTLREYVHYPYSFEPLALITHRTGPDGGCGDKDPTAVYFYHNDVNGAPLRLTDRTGAVVWRQAESGAWSTRYRQEGLVSNPLRFQGQYYDEESGLHYNRYRYYEPESGRYISADPIGLAGGINLYAYVPNPLKYIDPLGLNKETCSGTTRVRHYTNRKGSSAIAESGIIKAHDNGRVYLEPANKKPLSQVDIEAKYQIGRGKGRDYVETDVPNDQLEWVTNPRYHIDELTVKGDIILSDNAKITRRK